MSIIALVGPHAIGKTTAANRWAARYRNINVVHCDGKLPSNLGGVTILEGCSAMANRWLPQLSHRIALVVHCVCSPERLAQAMQERCTKKNKIYRDDYWTPRWLEYEASKRMDNLLAKRLPNVRCKKFEVEAHDDWRYVDEYVSAEIRLLLRVRR